MTVKRNQLSTNQKIIVYKALEEHLETVGERLVKYKGGMTDQGIADLMDFECTEGNVRGVRSEVFGVLERVHLSGVAGNLILAEKVEDVQKRLFQVEGRLDIIFNAMIDLLSDNRSKPLIAHHLKEEWKNDGD